MAKVALVTLGLLLLINLVASFPQLNGTARAPSKNINGTRQLSKGTKADGTRQMKTGAESAGTQKEIEKKDKDVVEGDKNNESKGVGNDNAEDPKGEAETNAKDETDAEADEYAADTDDGGTEDKENTGDIDDEEAEDNEPTEGVEEKEDKSEGKAKDKEGEEGETDANADPEDTEDDKNAGDTDDEEAGDKEDEEAGNEEAGDKEAVQSLPIQMRATILYLPNLWMDFKMLFTTNIFLYYRKPRRCSGSQAKV